MATNTSKQAGGAISTITSNPAIKAAAASNPWAAAALLAATVGGNYLSSSGEQQVKNEQSEALQNYLNSMDVYRQKAKDTMQGNYEQGENQFMAEANTALPELAQQKADIQQQTTEQQQEANKQLQSQLAQQGVRGGQAATLLGRNTGQLARESLRDENQLGFQEAQNRQNARLGYTAQKGLIPYKTLNSAEWLYMPTDTEKQLMTNAINTKFQ